MKKETYIPKNVKYTSGNNNVQGTAPKSTTLSLRSLMLSYAAPGQVLLMDEFGLHERLDELCSRSRGLVLRRDGTGGIDLTCKHDPLRELEEIAWS